MVVNKKKKNKFKWKTKKKTNKICSIKIDFGLAEQNKNPYIFIYVYNTMIMTLRWELKKKEIQTNRIKRTILAMEKEQSWDETWERRGELTNFFFVSFSFSFVAFLNDIFVRIFTIHKLSHSLFYYNVRVFLMLLFIPWCRSITW